MKPEKECLKIESSPVPAQTTSDSFCVEPWRQVHLDSKGRFGPCCAYLSREDRNQLTSIAEYQKSQDLQELKSRLAGGIHDIGCRQCYRHESEGKKSMRLIRNARYLNMKSPSKHLMITFGNVCNMGCRICNPSRSSLVDKAYRGLLNQIDSDSDKQLEAFIRRKISGAPQGLMWYNQPSFIEDLKNNLDQFESLEITGGEPFLNKAFDDLINFCAETNLSKKLSLRITTNGSFSTKQLSKLRSFKEVFLNFSVDGIGPTYEIMRWPTKWSWLKKQLAALQSHADYILWTFVFVPCNLNLNNLEESAHFFKDHSHFEKPFSFSFLNGVPFLSSWLCPQSVRIKAQKSISNLLNDRAFDFSNRDLIGLSRELERFPTASDQSTIDMLIGYIDKLDRLQNLNTWNAIGWHPELIEFF